MPTFSMYFNAVYVLESLPAGEPKTGTDLYDQVIAPATYHQDNLHTEFHHIENKSALLLRLLQIARECRRARRGPLLHIETHGELNGNGIVLQSGEFVSWAELKPHLVDLNVVSKLNLLAVISACSGAQLAQVVKPTDRAPVWGIIGPKTKISAADLFVGFSCFYREFLSSLDGRAALNALNGDTAIAEWPFSFTNAEWFFGHVYRNYLRKHTADAVLQEREEHIISQLKQRQSLSTEQERWIRQDAGQRLRDHRSFFERFRRNFFMIDLFPENVHRFPIQFSELEEGSA